MAQPKIFVSHSSKDTTFATQLVNDLNAAGAHAWLDVNDIVAGDFMDRINAALKDCEWFVLVLTENALKARWVPKEVNVALNLERRGRIRDLIFVRAGPVEDDEIPPMWSTINRIDAIANYQDAVNRVLKAVGLQPPPASIGISVYPELAIEAARRHVLARKATHDSTGNYVLWSDRMFTDQAQSRDRLRKRLLSREPAFQVGDVVERVDDQTIGVVCAVDGVTADVSWYGIREYVHGYWAAPETMPLDRLDLVDASPYPPPANGYVTTLQQSDISMARDLASSIQAERLDTPGAEICWAPANRLGRAWKVGDIVRRFSRRTEPGAKGVTFGLTGVICDGDKAVPQISWCYRDEHGEHWQTPEVVPTDQLLWLKIVDQSPGGHPARGS